MLQSTLNDYGQELLIVGLNQQEPSQLEKLSKNQKRKA
jgi:hypothetical protein